MPLDQIDVDTDLSQLIDQRPSGNQPESGSIKEVSWRGRQMKLLVGSPEWRDYQTDQFDYLVENPDKWQFVVSSDQEERVRRACVEFETHFNAPPDVGSIRMVLSNQFSVDRDGKPALDVKMMTDFWMEFVSDMPDLMRAAGATHSLNMMWIDRKILHILTVLGKKHTSWDEQELACNLRVPESLRSAAAGLETVEAAGFELFSLEESKGIVRWYFRKSKIVGPEEE